jgi:hypothetical protein
LKVEYGYQHYKKRNKGTKEQRNKGTKEQRNKGTKEQKEMNDLSKYGSWEKLDEFSDQEDILDHITMESDSDSDLTSEEINDTPRIKLEPSTPPTIRAPEVLEEGEVQEEEEMYDTPPAIRSLGRRAGQPRKRKQSTPKKFQPKFEETRQDYHDNRFYTKSEFEAYYNDDNAHWVFQHPTNIIRRQYLHDIIYYNPTLSNRKLDLLIDKMIAYAC